MARYQVSPIADANCNAINANIKIIETNDHATAKWHAEHNSCVWGAGILDRSSGQLDVGYGFGVPCPELPAP
jgi:hypothetical protein